MKLALSRPDPLRAEFGGPVGHLLRAVTEQWLLVAPDANPAMLEMFADRDIRPYRFLVPWAGEFAGKYLVSAVQVLRATGDGDLRAYLGTFVTRLVALQGADGYLGPWSPGCHLTGRAPNAQFGHDTWDAWGHYHVMLGLMLWHDESGDASALGAARRIGDLLCDRFLGDVVTRLVDTGETDKNLVPAHALAMLHARTGEGRYLALAEQLVAEFAATDDDGDPLAGDWLNQALAGREFYEMPQPRWESLHAIMALAELAALTDNNADYREAFERIWWSIARNDRHNNGGFSTGEQATGNPYAPGAIETCCTIAWLALSVEMLKLTGDGRVADEIEASTFNSVLGMHSPTGRWATYNTPSDGARFAGVHQIVFQARSGSPELNCCSVNAPRGLGLLSEWAVMAADDGITVNYYGPARFEVPLGGDVIVALKQETAYPIDGQIRIVVAPTRPAEFVLRLRIPGWSRRTAATVNGTPVEEVTPGSYLALSRTWREGDMVELSLDMGLRFWRGEREREGFTSVYRGPLLLAYDPRYNRDLHVAPAPPVPQRAGGPEGAPEADLPTEIGGFGENVWDTTAACLDVPVLVAGGIGTEPVSWEGPMPPLLLVEARTVDGGRVRLCDFAAAGQTGTLYRSWLPVADDL